MNNNTENIIDELKPQLTAEEKLEKKRAYSREYNRQNKERLKDYIKQYQKEHPEIYYNNFKKWRDNNKEQYKLTHNKHTINYAKKQNIKIKNLKQALQKVENFEIFDIEIKDAIENFLNKKKAG